MNRIDSRGTSGFHTCVNPIQYLSKYLFYLLNDIEICNFADDTTEYVCDFNLELFLEKLQENSELAVTWSEKYYMKLNTDK